MHPANRQDDRVTYRAFRIDCDAGCAAADIDERNSHFLFRGLQDGFARRERLEHDGQHIHLRVAHSLDKVLDRSRRRRDNVGFHLEPKSHHPHRLPDSILAIEREPSRQRVNDLPIRGNRNRLRRFHRPINVILAYPAAVMPDARNASRIGRRNMRPGNADVGSRNLHPGISLGLLHRFADSLRCELDIDNDSLAQARAGRSVGRFHFDPVLADVQQLIRCGLGFE